MMHGLKEFIAFFEDSSVADAIRENDVLFPSIESVHVLAICLVVGSIMAVDLRLLGFASVKRPVSAITRGILPLTWGAFVVAVASGLLMFISNAAKYLGNGFFVAKLCLIAAAGLNMLVFHFISARNQPRWDAQARLPLSARLAGGISMMLWIAVVACGRWIGFTMEPG
jgi:tryptophan-rich sensory protein